MKQRQYEIYYWRRFRTWYRDKNQRTVRPEKLEFDEALQEAFYKVRTGEIFDELE